MTNYNAAVSSWLAQTLQLGTVAFAIQETHHAETEMRKTQKRLLAWGFEGNFLAAEPTGRGGNAGGQFVVATRHVGVSTLAAYNLSGNGWCGILLESAGSRLALFSNSLKTGEGVMGPSNCKILGALKGCLQQLADEMPWLVVGD